MHPVVQSPPMPETSPDDAEAGRPLVPESQPNTKKKYSTTMLDHFYLILLMLSGTRLISAVVVAGMCAGIVSRVPTGPLMGMAVFGIFHVGALFPPPGNSEYETFTSPSIRTAPKTAGGQSRRPIASVRRCYVSAPDP
ncbi:hypothetical protein B0T11DRAFT_354184 [Plectosphaerella cucumerina]|uniref:Uncharacterized protein n=1 Tax=Plectosphaerella cucumerina TaxID=40658 RepID=A0A8K0TBR4_9PEZI|nr:hypothetical protein B0T11DRAFT_354184 [Plectosphaerella cucumerina]